MTYNTEVVYLNVENCALESLIVNSDSMTYLDCQNNNLEELDLTNVSNLTYLNISNNNISYIDVSNCTNLNKILVEYNPLVCLDLSNNPIVKTLSDTGLIRNLTQTTCNPLEFIGLDTSKITQITGANILDGKIYPTSTTVKYTYQCNDTISADFTLTLPIIMHTYIYVSVDETSHKTECPICGSVFVKSEAHVFDNSCDTSCNKCDYERTITHKYISKYDSNDCNYTRTASHNYRLKSNTTTHWQQCTICNNKINITNHTYILNNNSINHWEECSVCGIRKNVISHKFDNTCDISCNDCNYTRTISHKYIAKYDSTSHWKECSICGDKIDVTSHKFDNACDTSCNDCNYTRTISHKYISKYDSTSHWDECSICHQVERYSHVYTVTSKNGISYYTCTDCNYSKSEITYDFNNNETLDSMDIIILKKYVLNMVEQPKSLSYHFDMLDYLILKNRILESK